MTECPYRPEWVNEASSLGSTFGLQPVGPQTSLGTDAIERFGVGMKLAVHPGIDLTIDLATQYGRCPAVAGNLLHGSPFQMAHNQV